LNTLLQGAWGLLLGHLLGRDDVVFGITVAGRPPELPGIERMIGLFINTVPLRLQFRAAESIIKLLTRLQNEQAYLLAYQYVGLTEIQRLTGLGDLFDTLVVFENYPVDHQLQEQAPPELGVTYAGGHGGDVSHYPLSLLILPGEELQLHLAYRPDLFDRITVETWAERLLRLLRVVAEDPNRPVGSIDLLTPQERHQILVEWNGTVHLLPEATLPELFEAQVAKTPNATAVVFKNTSLAYAQLNARANQLAHHLIKLGVGPEDIVGLCLPRSFEMVVALLVILKAGAAYLPLDPNYPAERLAFMLHDVRPWGVLTTIAATAQLPHDALLLHLDNPDITVALAGASETNPTNQDRLRPFTPNNPAHVIYTSGSTGTPKGVIVSQGSLSNFFAAIQPYVPLTPADRVLATTTLSFDPAGLELFLPLIRGAQTIIATREAVRDPALMAQLITEHDINILQATPSFWQNLIDIQPQSLAGLSILVGGETLPVPQARRLVELSGHRITNLYGLTETTIWSTATQLDDTLLGEPSLGHLIWNTWMYVLNSGLQPMPAGVTGELYITGAGLARGYLNRPGLTAERFVANPFGPPGSRMYRSGDLARWRPDGVLDFLGRVDDQVKIRGFRIELGEVEAALSLHDSVAQAAVIAREGQSGHKQLVAYVVPKADTPLDPIALRHTVAEQLPDYMVPAAVVLLNALPLTPNGKLDRRALPASTFTSTRSRTPRTPQEEILCAIFAEVLGLEHVGIDDPWWPFPSRYPPNQPRALMELTIRSLFEAPSVGTLTQRLEGHHTADAFTVLLPLRAHGSRPPLFCLHPAGGLSWSYAGLLRHLPSEQPIYGLQSHSFTRSHQVPSTVDTIAADYLQEIQAVQPNGPYYLLGWSLGGPLAHAIATQLQDQHESVPLLALLDCYPPPQDVDLAEPTDQEIFATLIRTLLDEPDELDHEVVSFSSFKERLGQASHPMASLDDSILQVIIRQFKAAPRLLKSFSPRLFHDDLLFFRAMPSAKESPRQSSRGLAPFHPRSDQSARYHLRTRKDDAS